MKGRIRKNIYWSKWFKIGRGSERPIQQLIRTPAGGRFAGLIPLGWESYCYVQPCPYTDKYRNGITFENLKSLSLPASISHRLTFLTRGGEEGKKCLSQKEIYFFYVRSAHIGSIKGRLYIPSHLQNVMCTLGSLIINTLR